MAAGACALNRHACCGLGRAGARLLIGDSETQREDMKAEHRWIPALLFGLRLSASVCVALYLAFWFQLDDAYWAGTSAAIVAQPGLGASLRKGRFRAIGTLLGGLVIVLLTAIFPQDHGGLLLSLALWAAVCGCFATILPNFAGYAAALSGYTAAVVFVDEIANPQNVFVVAASRVTEISIGVLSAGLVHALTDFGDATERLGRAFADIGHGIASGLGQTLRTGRETLELRMSRRVLIGRVIALDATIDEVLGEPSHLRYRAGVLQAAEESLYVALSAWRAIGNHIDTIPGQQTPALAGALLPRLSNLEDRSWLDDPRVVREICASERCGPTASAADVSSRLIFDGVKRTLEALERVANALMVVVDPAARSSGVRHSRLYVPDLLPVMLNGTRILLTVLAAELFWILTEWPDGPIMIIFTAATVILFSALGDQGYPSAIEYAFGSAMAGILAAILNLAILPSVNGTFLTLSLVLSLFLVPLGALSARSWHKPAFTAVVANFLPILAIENAPNYDAGRLLNTALAVCAGTLAGALSIGLIQPLPPARRIQRLLTLTLNDLRRLFLQRRHFAAKSWVARVSRRLAAMPSEATLEETAELLAALSVGQAAIALLQARPRLSAGQTLDRGLAELAEANVPVARQTLLRFCTQQGEQGAADFDEGADAAVLATLIADALRRHPRFFAREAEKVG
jgi:uncharacterized membrane protein YccC